MRFHTLTLKDAIYGKSVFSQNLIENPAASFQPIFNLQNCFTGKTLKLDESEYKWHYCIDKKYKETLRNSSSL